MKIEDELMQLYSGLRKFMCKNCEKVLKDAIDARINIEKGLVWDSKTQIWKRKDKKQ